MRRGRPQKDKTLSAPLSLLITPEDKQRLTELAERQNITVSELLRRQVEKLLKGEK